MIPSEHPSTCRVCHGDGWQHGPDNVVTNDAGQILRVSTTVVPCMHHWANDPPEPDEVVALDAYLARYPDDDALARLR